MAKLTQNSSKEKRINKSPNIYVMLLRLGCIINSVFLSKCYISSRVQVGSCNRFSFRSYVILTLYRSPPVNNQKGFVNSRE